jgi:hypothetical protein
MRRRIVNGAKIGDALARFGVLGVVLALSYAGTAVAAAPTLVSPISGASYEAQSPPAFTVSDSPPAGSLVYLRISRSPAVDAAGEIGSDVDFAEMSNQWLGGPVTASSTTWTWTPNLVPGSYPWTPGTYYWQVSHIDCAALPTCDVLSPVWSFVITPVPPPQPILPADGATVAPNSLVSFTVSSALPGDLGTRIIFGDGSQIVPYGYGVGTNANDSYFRIQVGGQPGMLSWTVARADCELAPSCALVDGVTRTLTVAAPSPPSTVPSIPPPAAVRQRAACRRGYTAASIGRRNVCLHAGEFCSSQHLAQYRRYGYVCVRIARRYRLRRRS